MNLIEKMSTAIDSMTFGEKFFASLQVTILGLVIVFIALAILYFAIVAMEKLINNKPKAEVEKVETKASPVETVVSAPDETKEETIHIEDSKDDTELIAVITAAIAASLGVPAQTLTIKGVKQVEEPIWAKLGRIQQINNML